MKGILMGSIRSWLVRKRPTRTVLDVLASTGSGTPSSEPLNIRTLLQSDATDNYEQFGPVMRCLCGSELFIAILSFDERDRSIGQYFTNGRCAVCHADVTLATEIDEMVGA
jgi:hypothetical protein